MNASEDDKTSLAHKLESLGFGSTMLLPNLGSLLIFLAIYILAMGLVLILNCIARRCPILCKGRTFGETIFWEKPIEFFMSSFSVIVICSMYNVVNLSWSNTWEIVNSALAILILTLLILYPVLMQRFLHKNKHLLKNRVFRTKYSMAYNGLK